jgi:DNA-binding transcriptional regulator WhiA
MALNQEKLSYLLGAIYGDGCFTRDGKVSFSSTDKEFIEEVCKIVNNLFGLKLNIRFRKLSAKNKNWRDSYEFSSRRLYRLLSKFDLKRIRKLPNFVSKTNKNKRKFIKGLFDAEGGIDLHTVKRKDGRTDIIRHLKCFSNNVELLEQIKDFLAQLKIESKIFKGKMPNYYICIWSYRNLKSFYESIGFVIKRKQEQLKEALNSYKEVQVQWNFNTYNTVMNFRRKENIGSRLIRKKLLNMSLNVPQPTIESWIYHRSRIIEK